MVNDLKDASLLETRRMALTRERAELCALARAIVEQIPEVAPRTKISAPAGRQLYVQGDTVRIAQVLTNLLHLPAPGAPQAVLPRLALPRRFSRRTDYTIRSEHCFSGDLTGW
jgi:hypothetical protein